MDIETVANIGFLVVFGVSVLGGVAWVGRRLLSEDKGVLTLLANKHIEFLGKVETSTEKMAGSHERLVELNEDVCAGVNSNAADIQHLKRAGHNACKVLRSIAVKLEVYDEVKDSLSEIDHAVSSPRAKGEIT